MFVLFRSEHFFSGPEQVEMREIIFRFLCSGIRGMFFVRKKWGKWFSLTGLTDFSSFGFSFAEEEIMNNFLFLFSFDS
jgi:hypothetical protein